MHFAPHTHPNGQVRGCFLLLPSLLSKFIPKTIACSMHCCGSWLKSLYSPRSRKKKVPLLMRVIHHVTTSETCCADLLFIMDKAQTQTFHRPGLGGLMVGSFTNVRNMIIMTHNVRDMCRSFFLEYHTSSCIKTGKQISNLVNFGRTNLLEHSIVFCSFLPISLHLHFWFKCLFH